MKNGDSPSPTSPQDADKTASVSPFRALLLASFLVGIGFFVGLGFQSRAYQARRISQNPSPTPTAAPVPLVKGLQSAPDGKKLAFTSVLDDGTRAGIWVFDMQTRRAAFTPSPLGWQDFVNSWAPDGRALLIEREKIPRPVAQAEAGIYRVPVEKKAGSPPRASENPTSLMPLLPRGERLISGFRGADGQLYLKTRREPKRIFRVKGENAIRLDESSQNYGQNRVVVKNGQSSLLVVKNIGDTPEQALFRVTNGKSQQISAPLGDLSWSYVSLRGNFLLTARDAGDEENWEWTLYRIGARAQKIKTGLVPLDVISVYWSPDEKRVLGAAGEKLWVVEIPTLGYTRLGERSEWNADDATWLGQESAAVIAAQGGLWWVQIPSGETELLWKFPSQPWK